MTPEPNRQRVEPAETTTSSGGGIGQFLLMILVVAIILAAIGFATGLLGVSTSGDLEAPTVAVSGGEVPRVAIDTPDISVGSKSVMVEVPEVTVDKPAEQPRN